MNTKTSANNRSLTQNGANKLFAVIGIKFFKDPLGFWYSEGYIAKNAPTLTKLCQSILLDLVSVKEQSDRDQKTYSTLQDPVSGKVRVLDIQTQQSIN